MFVVVGINEGTKSLSLLLNGEKSYVTSGVLGAKTDTEDAEGKVVETMPFKHVTRQKLERELEDHFTGEIWQIPPM